MQRQDLPVTRRGDLTDEQWNRIYSYLPVGRRGRPFDNVRDTLNGILRILRTGLPEEICRLSVEAGMLYINALPNGKRQVYLSPYSESFPKMSICRM